MRHARPILGGHLIRAAEVTCRAPCGGRGPEEFSDVREIVMPRRGVFRLHRGARTVTADALTAVVLDGEYRVSHPVAGGDRCLALVYAAELHEEALGDARVLRARHQVTVATTVDPLAAEEWAMQLLADLAAAPRLGPSPRVEAVRGLLAANPTRRWTLAEIGRAVHTSPYHLARQFRGTTGHTIASYLLGLRLAIALDRLRQGERDLARLAAELGFASHSHFTERVRRTYGRTPSQLRTMLTASRSASA